MSARRPQILVNSGPLISLAAVGRLHLLNDLFEEVLIPPAVRREVVDDGVGLPGSEAVARAGWIVTAPPPANQALLTALGEILGPGESEVIALALELNAALAILDDGRARRAAKRLGVPVRGTLGVLVEAKRQGRLPAVGPVVDAMVEAGFHASAQLVAEARARAGER